MKRLLLNNVKEKLVGLVFAMSRYPLTILFLFAAAIINILSIQQISDSYVSMLWTFFVGAVLGIVAQQVYERFSNRSKQRVQLYVVVVLLTIGYYFTIFSIETFTMQMEIKTAVFIFALLMVFIWIPSIRNKVLFNETFMATFKAFFTTVLFTAVIAIGISLSVFAIDQLLFGVDGKVYSHLFNIIFILFAPLFFLSQIPVYPGSKDVLTDEEKVRITVATACPKVLAILLSYIVIPLTALYTLILIVYVLVNIRGDFWTENLLEPMLVSYSIVVILLLILVSGLTDAFATFAKKVLPKVLLPIVLFQLIASTLKIGELGITHGRYYVILFGLFAFITSVIFSFYPIRKSGWIAAVLIVFSTVSIIPPVDAFTVSRVNQTKTLQKVLTENGMLQDGAIIPNGEISTEDKRKVTETVRYLEWMQYTTKIDWLPENLYNGNRFEQTFGFHEVYDEGNDVYNGKSAYLEWESDAGLNIEGYDQMLRLPVNQGGNVTAIPLKIRDTAYQLKEMIEDGEVYLLLTAGEQMLMRFNVTEAVNEIVGNSGALTVEEATVTEENESVRMTIIADYIDVYDGRLSGQVYLLIEMK